MKKNTEDHLSSNIHTIAVKRLREKSKAISSQQIAATFLLLNQEKKIVEHVSLSKTEKQ